MKILLGTLLLLSLFGGLGYSYFSKNISSSVNNNISGVSENLEEADQTETQSDQKNDNDIVRQKIENIKKRLALKGLIIEGDTYYRNQEHTEALKKYLEFYRSHPDDPLIIEKIGNTYMREHRYKNALAYFTKIENPTTELKNKIAENYLYTSDLSTENGRTELSQKIDTIKLPDTLYFYYQNSIKCVQDFATCKFDFKNYLRENSLNDEGENILHPKLQAIQNALTNYENFQLEGEYLKNTYILGALYQDALYPVAIELGKQILNDKPGYKPVIKIIAQSEFELGRYTEAKSILSEFYKADNDDPNVAYILGLIHEELGELVLSNIHLQKALKLGFEPSIDVRRQLIHNYYLLKNDEKTLEAFADLVENEKFLEKEDLGLAIYHHIIHEKYITAQTWSKKGQSLFPDSANFFAYESWVLREQGNISKALSVLQQGLSVDKENPFILINIGYTLLEDESKVRAKRYFKQVLDVAPESIFAAQAREELKKIETIN